MEKVLWLSLLEDNFKRLTHVSRLKLAQKADFGVALTG